VCMYDCVCACMSKKYSVQHEGLKFNQGITIPIHTYAF